MLFPKERLKFSATCEGKRSSLGFAMLNLRGLDLEGINEICVDLSIVEERREERGEQETRAEEIKRLFGEAPE